MCPPHSNREQIHSSENRDGQFLSSGSLRPGICPPLGLWLAHQHTATKDVGAVRKLSSLLHWATMLIEQEEVVG